jgi:hypothetical protein
MRNFVNYILQHIPLIWTNQDEWDGREYVARMAKKGNAYKMIWKPERDKSLRRYMRRLDVIKVDIKEIRLDPIERIHLAQGRNQRRVLVNTVINLLASHNARNSLRKWATTRFSRRALLHLADDNDDDVDDDDDNDTPEQYEVSICAS